MPDPSTQLAITNSTTVDFVVIDSVAQTSASGQTTGTTLKLLPTTAGAQSIAKGTTASVTLNDTYTDPTTGQTQPSLLYRLVLSTTDWLIPVDVEGVLQDISTGLYDPITVQDSSRTNMLLALDFLSKITAYPSSNLAVGYNNAVNASVNASQSQSADSATQAIDDFFKTTQGYTNVTFDMVMAINSYFNSFPFIWARQQNAMTYYLYSSDGTNPTTYVGQLTMTRSATGIPDVTDSNGGYELVYTDANNANPKSLSYVNGQFVNDPKADIPDICLVGTYTLKSRLTGQASDIQVMTLLSGTIHGNTVIGLDTKQQQDSSSQRSYWQTLFDPQGAQEVINSILTIAGLLFTLHFIATGLWGIGQRIRQRITGENPKTDFEKIQEQLDALNKKMTAGRQKFPSDSRSIEDGFRSSMDNISIHGQKSILADGIRAESLRLQTLVKAMPEGPTPQMQDAARQLRTMQSTLKNAAPKDLPDLVKAQAQQFLKLQDTITSQVQAADKFLSKQAKAQLAEQEIRSKALSEDITKLTDDARIIDSADVPKTGEDFRPLEL